jgi:UDP-N-acetylmuramoylalanine--D-glutamate ligase
MINLPFAKNKTYYVVGLGKSNQSALKSLKKAGADVRVWDDSLDNLKGIDDKMVCPPEKAPWSKIRAIVAAPGVSPSHQILVAARDKETPVICDVDLFFQSAPSTTTIGVTGTNGKSTTVALIHHILNAERKAQMGGNIGEPVLNLKSKIKYTVLELSSYQLEYGPNIACDVAVLLNISKDHLDWHEAMDNYVAAKARIFNGAGTKIISVDDQYSKSVYEDHESDAVPLSIYGEDLPLLAADFPKLKGQHNFQNILAAYYACFSIGLPHEDILERIKSFDGLEHRQYFVRNINGVPYINDSKATNAEAAKHALNAFRNIVWIAGGIAKDGGLEPLDGHLNHIQKAVLYGEAADDFAKFLSVRGIEVETCVTLEEAVNSAHKKAQDMRGEPTGSPTVLLSPACASFDQFKNFEERGNFFVDLVAKIDPDL